MGNNDIYLKRWLSDEARFADLFNEVVYRGKKILTADKVHKTNNETEFIIKQRNGREIGIHKYRDIIMEVENGEQLVLLATENQQEIHYAMPVRGMLYDALTYTEQIQRNAKANRKEKSLKQNSEFLSGIKKDDKLIPVITIVLYYGHEKWDGSRDIHSMLDLENEEYEGIKNYIPNYYINLVDVCELAKNNTFKTDLQWIFGMLKYKNNRESLLEYIHEHSEYFSKIDDDTFGAAKALLGCRRLPRVEAEKGAVDMCKALDELYEDGLQKGIQKGIQKGLQKGQIDKTKVIIGNMLQRGMSDEDICVLAECDLSLIEEVRKNL